MERQTKLNHLQLPHHENEILLKHKEQCSDKRNIYGNSLKKLGKIQKRGYGTMKYRLQ